MTTIRLRGITWNHSRAYPPLIAASQRYEELHPHVRVEWHKRSLDEFGHAGLAELAGSYDLLVIDHPMLGEVHRDGILIDLLPHLQPEAVAELQADALGPCLESYRYEGCLYALPIDAAAPAASYRADLLERRELQLPETWDQLIKLAQAGGVCMPGFPADLFLNFLGMCISRSGMIASAEQFLNSSIATQCLHELRELASFMPASVYSMNPIAVYETMTTSDVFAYCPFAYTYSNYSRPGFAAQSLLFTNPVPLRDGTPLRTVLGGTGIAISPRCDHADLAIDFSLFLAGRSCQSSIYGVCGGQPASKAAWRDPLLNQISHHFFERTIASIENARVRPRYAGYIQLQRIGGRAVAAHLRDKLTAAQALNQLEEIYRSSITTTKANQEPKR